MQFFTSDTHFSHQNIIRFCDRPFKDTDHMDEEIIRRWNSVVSEDDTVWHLGDVALGPIATSLPKVGRLNGYKILVVGNHERIFGGESAKHRDRFQPEYEKVFDEIYDNIEFTNFDGIDQEVALSHFPYEGDSHDGDRYTEYRLADEGRVLLHGHTHLDNVMSFSKNGSLQIHVGQDAWDYTPVSIDQISQLVTQFGNW